MENENASARGTVFVQTNEEGQNHVLVFGRSADGALSGPARVATGGRGDGVPHLTSQGSVVLTGDGRHLLVTNAGSNDVSVFSARDGDLSLVATVPSDGEAPKSIAEHVGLVYVLNAGSASLVGFRLAEDGLERLAGSEGAVGAGADPAQVGFAPDGSRLIVTDRGTNSIVVYSVEADGRLGDAATSPSSGPTPYGFAFGRGGTLVVTEAFGAEKGKAAASSYRVAGKTVEPVSRSIGNGRSEICWAVVTADGRYAFTTNFADGAVSCYAIADDGSITLENPVAGAAVEGRPGLRDEDLTSDGRFLYAVDTDGGKIVGWAVEGGRLSALGSWNGLPRTAAGLAAS
ncbi:MAG TPA: beta-propeller fold lactonase family protein [Gaiellaceae bacterium]|nr:beta-propeller fold lactonase family protein [Gaiellaceae bacterium]